MTQCAVRKCKEDPFVNVIYDAGETEQKLTLCKNHYDSNQVFKQFIKSIEEIKN